MEKRRIGNFCNAAFEVIGYPDDLGVKNVKGRPGAALGPGRFLDFFHKLNGRIPVRSGLRKQTMVAMGADLEVNLRESARITGESVRGLDSARESLIVVGGGHDYAYPWIKGIRDALGPRKKLACINIDAHFDLRTYESGMTSGSPFRRLIEEGILDPRLLVEFGIQNHCNGPDLWEYARKMRITTVPFEKVRNSRAIAVFKRTLAMLEKKADLVLLSVDLDALSLAVAPGVSAPQPEGFSASDLFQMLEHSAARRKVFSVGIFELSPEQDFKDLTARLAAQAVWKFLHARATARKERR